MTSADVHKAGRLAATLSTVGPDTVFRYLPGYDGPAVATTLPLGTTVTRPGRSLPPFFTNLLPEGRRLSALQREVKTSGDDELSLLLAVGSDPIGDVQVLPAGEAPSRPEPVVDGDGELDFQTLLAEHGIDPVAIPGAQDKLSAGMITLPGRARGGGPAIVKLTPPDYPFAVENEAHFLRTARGLRLPVAAASVVTDVRGARGLVVSRFDRDDGPKAVEDGCQLLGRYSSDKYLLSGEEVADAVAGVCAARAVALRNVFLQFMYAWLIGNGDLHAKNLSVLQSAGGEWQVAPIYDVLSTLPYGDHTMALSMGGRTAGFTRKHLLDFGLAIGLPEAAATRALDLALAATEGVDASLDALPFNENMLRDLRRQLARRRRDAQA